MTPLQFARRDEQLHPGQGPFAVDPSPLLGTWINTNRATTGIARVAIAPDGDGVSVSVWPIDASGDRPRYRATTEVLYSSGPTVTAAMALSTSYEDEFAHTVFQANLSLGLLVVVTCHTFQRGDPRSNYFSREFFHYAGEPSN